MSTPFVPLHVHTDYSLLDGACRIADLAERAAEMQLPAIACTDHGNMCAVIEFYQQMQARKIKPILGCEVYVAPKSRLDRDASDPHTQGFHLILLAENLEGYQNLCRLNTLAWTEGFYYKARIDKEILARHAAGLVALSACIGGEVPALLLEEHEDRATAALKQYLEIFGKERFFLEVQNHGLPEELTVNRRLFELGREFGVRLVATNDSHYLRKEHWRAHDVLLCIGTQKVLEDKDRLRFHGEEFYLKDGDEMATLFPGHPEVLENTLEVAARCNLELELGPQAKSHYPVYAVAGDQTREGFLRQLCVTGMKDRYGFDAAATLTPEQTELVRRMDYELGIIAQTGFTSYFLVVWDFLDYARRQGIPVGPGRGSGAGSIVAYLTHITDIDPIRYGLLFERFLNPDRVSPPDFDIDLCERRRHEVIEYVRGKYGRESVAQIATFGTLKAKAVLKDVARTLNRPFAEVNLLTKRIPADPKMTLGKALEESAELREMVEREGWVREVMDYSRVLEGLNRNLSIHAAGVIIGDGPLPSLVPLTRGMGDEVITQYGAGACESLGLLKMDFLGLRTLTIIQDAVDMVERNRGIKLDMSTLPLDDAAAYALLNKGHTVAVFQLESQGFRDLCRRFGVHRIEDIIALIALYRPGPMQFLDEFISRKTGQTKVEYDLPVMRAVLEETYGIMLYQEQVMQVVQRVAGFSLGQADILRRVMGKKKLKEMEQMNEKFMKGCADNGVSPEVATNIWEKINRFAGYGFNKSHSAAYAMLSYRTAYLKANYPLEFMAAVLSSELGNADRMAFFLRETHEMGIDVRPPDVNSSGLSFSVDGDCIRFGLAGIKGVGRAAAEHILAAREKGRFTGLLDFCERVTDAKISRRVLECLCRAGAFDCFGVRRAQIFAMLDDAMASAHGTATDRAAGQGSLFSLQLSPPDIPEWDGRELLAQEKELLGFYVTGHPLAEYMDTIRTFQSVGLQDVGKLPDNAPLRIGGLLAAVDVRSGKKDQRLWAALRLEGMEGAVECLAFGDTYEQNRDALVAESTVFVEGRAMVREGEEVRIRVDRVIPILAVPEQFTEELHVRLHQADSGTGDLERLRALCAAHPGETALLLCVICANGEIAFIRPATCRIRNSAEFRATVRDLFGAECLREKPAKLAPAAPNGRNGGRFEGRRPARAAEPAPARG